MNDCIKTIQVEEEGHRSHLQSTIDMIRGNKENVSNGWNKGQEKSVCVLSCFAGKCSCEVNPTQRRPETIALSVNTQETTNHNSI